MGVVMIKCPQSGQPMIKCPQSGQPIKTGIIADPTS
jgi:hypothetical protein